MKPKFKAGDTVYFVFPNVLQAGKIIRAFGFSNAVAPDVPVYEVATAVTTIVLNETCLFAVRLQVEYDFRSKLAKIMQEFERSTKVPHSRPYWTAVTKQIKMAEKRDKILAKVSAGLRRHNSDGL
ncbi:MAG: hypothetical protein A2Y06_02375 [Omnitrophica WOR_2 bacterium GWA2_37_7]|nr:MAG: hypothetical protein A2Y06_02375 [Omnitrophica WOR_2 bacterium GWA2_37_7]